MTDMQQRITQTAHATLDLIDGVLQKLAPPPDLLASLISARKRKRRP
jgi:hypothetical protein